MSVPIFTSDGAYSIMLFSKGKYSYELDYDYNEKKTYISLKIDTYIRYYYIEGSNKEHIMYELCDSIRRMILLVKEGHCL